MNRLILALCVGACLSPSPAIAEEGPPTRHVIEGIAPMSGREAMVKALTRALRVTLDPKLSEDYLFGITGTAFLATVCANNCNCRDFRELYSAINPTLDALGVPYEYFEGKDEAIWGRIKASIAAGVPVTAWNLFGDKGDAALVGYDEEKDLAYGWGIQPGGPAYMTAPLSKWKAEGMYGYLVRPGEKIDRKALERKQLELVVRMAHRAALEGG